MKLRTAVSDRFWSKAIKTDHCWVWTGKVGNRGYGVASVAGKKLQAHRVAWTLTNGREPAEGMYICHRCDNPVCVNPAHLYEGTPTDNVRDMVSRGRNKGIERGYKYPPGTHVYVRHAPRWSKLNEAKASEIREMYKTHKQPEIAARFGISQSLVSLVVTRKCWTQGESQ